MTTFFGTASDILGLEEVQKGLRAVPPVIERIFDLLCERSFSPEEVSQIYLNKHVLLHALESYYCDLYRLTIFRGIEADYHKQAAFLIKWIVKLRPVQIHADVVNPRLLVLLCNELLAVAVGLIVLFRSVADSTSVVTNEIHYLCNLIYLLHYHSCISPEQLASELYQLEKRYVV
jgi:hypothetical protein